jgi:subtilisin family serine protease
MTTPLTRYARSCFVLLVIAAAARLLSGGLFAQGPGGRGPKDRVNGREAEANEVIVKYRNPKSAAERNQINAIVDADKDDPIGDDEGRIRHIRSRRFDAATLVAYFSGAPDVEYAEPNYTLYAINTPSDPNFGNLWGLLNIGQTVGSPGTAGADIDATLVWDTTTGTPNVVVGVVDTGVDYDHIDLAGNIWSAPTSFTLSIAGQSLTCPAGSHGFNAITNSCDPKDANNHGTHVSGTIGARANNGAGVVGVNWTTSIMGLKFLAANGSGSTIGAVNAIDFAIKAKQFFGASANVRVLSNSWGGGGFSQTLLTKINEANAAATCSSWPQPATPPATTTQRCSIPRTTTPRTSWPWRRRTTRTSSRRSPTTARRPWTSARPASTSCPRRLATPTPISTAPRWRRRTYRVRPRSSCRPAL